MGAFRAMGLIRALAPPAALLAALLAAAPAFAHRLVIYAYAEAGEVVVESEFSNGAPAGNGSIVVTDGDGAVLTEMPLSETGVTRFAVPEGGDDGIAVEVVTDAGHEDYWILTPEDLSR